MLNIIKNTINRVFASGVDSDASAFITATGLSGTTQKSAITTLVKDLKSSGLWSKMKAVYPMVTDNYNLISYSEDLSNAYWSKNNLSITTNAINSPTGVLTADKIIEAATTGAHYLGNSAGVMTTTSNYTASTYFKAAERNWVYLYLYNGTSAFGAYFNLSNGTLGTINGGVTATITDAGNGWYRCTVSASIIGTASSNTGITLASADNVTSYTGVAGNGIYQWGFQLEVGTSASAYQPILTTPSAFMASQMKYNLKDARDLDAAFRLTWSGGWTYSATGATPNGTNAFADTKLNPFVNLVKNNAHAAHYFRTAFVSNVGYGVVKSDYTERMDMIQFSSVLYSAIGASGQTSSSSTPYTSLIVGSRVNSTTNKLYKANTLLNTQTTANSSEFPNANYWLGAVNQSAGLYANNQVAFSSIGDGLTDQEAFLLNQIVEKYQVALSRGVQAAQSFYYNSAYSNESNTYLYSTQITGTTQVSAINTLINGLKANNLWTKMKAVYPFVTDIKNMLAYTEDFTNANWGKQNITVTANSIIAPDGTTTADTVTSTASGASYVILSQALPPLTNGQIYTISRYVKAGTANFCTLGLHALADAFFDLNNLTYSFSGTGAVSASITDVGNGWRRITATYTWSGTTYNAYFAMASSLTNYFNNTVGNYQYTWGGQLEIGSVATAYQPILGANNYATNVAAQMKFNLVNPQDTDAAFRLAFSGGWTYSTNGAQPNGTNGFADTFLIPNTSLSTSSSHLSFYSRTNTTSGTGYELARTHYALITQFSGNTFYANLETVGSYAASYTSTNGLGHFIASRINNTTTQGFKNGLKVINASQNSSLATSSLIISNNGLSNYSNKQTAFVSIGDGFTDAEAALFYQLIQQFQTDLSRQV